MTKLTPPPLAELRGDARANRQRILQAATATFAAKGIGAEVKDIAETAGVAVGTIYRHFPSKEDLLAALVREAMTVVRADMAATDAEPDPVAAIRLLLERGFAMALHFGWLVDMMMGGQMPPRCRLEMESEADAGGWKTRYDTLITRAIAAGQIRPDVNVNVLSALLAGTRAPWNLHRFSAGMTPAEAADAVVAILLHGVSSSAPSETTNPPVTR